MSQQLQGISNPCWVNFQVKLPKWGQPHPYKLFLFHALKKKKKSQSIQGSPEGTTTESQIVVETLGELIYIFPWKRILATLGLLLRYITQMSFNYSNRKQIKTFSWPRSIETIVFTVTMWQQAELQKTKTKNRHLGRLVGYKIQISQKKARHDPVRILEKSHRRPPSTYVMSKSINYLKKAFSMLGQSIPHKDKWWRPWEVLSTANERF